MNTLPRHLIPAAIAMTATTAFAAIDDLQPSHIAEHARWIVHVDIERLMDSTLSELLKDDTGEFPPLIEDNSIWQRIEDETDFNPYEDLKSLTIFNAGPLDSDSVVLIEATPKIEEIVRMLPDVLPSHRVTRIDGNEMHSWEEIEGETRRQWFAHVRPAADPNRRLCIVSENWEQALDAVNRIEAADEGGPSPSILAVPPGEGSVLYLAAGEVNDFGNFGKDGPESGIMSMVRSIVLDVRQVQQTVTLDSILTAREDGRVEDVAQVLQGFIALARLAVANDPDKADLKDLLSRIRIASDDGRLRISISCPAHLVAGSVRASGLALDSKVRNKSFDIGVSVGSEQEDVVPEDATNARPHEADAPSRSR